LIEEGFDPSRLLAITFAKKAVLEIQSRLKKRLNGNGNKALVCTFHSLGHGPTARTGSLARSRTSSLTPPVDVAIILRTS
jgi:ATP-dependent DNA helicase Rep